MFSLPFVKHAIAALKSQELWIAFLSGVGALHLIDEAIAWYCHCSYAATLPHLGVFVICFLTRCQRIEEGAL